MIKTSTYHQTQKEIKAEQTVIEIAKKSPQHFEELYNKYHEQIFYFVFNRTNDEHVSHDITSQVFLSAMLNLYRYQFKGVPFSSWLYRIALNECNKYFNQNKSMRNTNVDTNDLKHLTEELEQKDNEENIQQLLNALSKINEETLQIIELRYFEQLSFKEIGEILEITENNAKVRLYRALDKLKSIILNP